MFGAFVKKMNTAWPFWKERQTGTSRIWFWVPLCHFSTPSLLNPSEPKHAYQLLLTVRHGHAIKLVLFFLFTSRNYKWMVSRGREFSVMHYQHSGTQTPTSLHTQKHWICLLVGTLRRMQTVTQKYLSFTIQNGTPFFFSLPCRFCFSLSLSSLGQDKGDTEKKAGKEGQRAILFVPCVTSWCIRWGSWIDSPFRVWGKRNKTKEERNWFATRLGGSVAWGNHISSSTQNFTHILLPFKR